MTNWKLFLLHSYQYISTSFPLHSPEIAYGAQTKIRFDHIGTSNQTQIVDRENKKGVYYLGVQQQEGG